MEIVNVPFRKLKIPLLRKLYNEEIYGEKLLNTLEFPRSLDDAITHYGYVCCASRGI